MGCSIYNEITYNEALYYGCNVAFDAELLWGLLIDWTNDNSYNGGFNEARYLQELKVTRGREHLVTNNGWERYKPGRIIATLDNEDGRYDPYNASSPIYGYIFPGKYAKLQVKYDGTVYDVMSGIVEDIRPYNKGRKRQVKISIVDGLQFLTEQLTYWPKTNATTFYFAKSIADNAGWPEYPNTPLIYGAGVWTYQYLGITDKYVMAFFWKHKALEAITILADIFLAQVLHSADGKLTLVGSNYTYSSTTDLDESECLAEIEVSQPWDLVRNEISIVEHPYTSAGSTTVWNLNSAIPINNGDSVTFDAIFSYSTYYPVGIASVSAASVTVNTQAGGGGSDLSDLCTIETTTPGEGTTITVTNWSGSNGYIIAASITGAPFYSPNNTVYTVRDTTSQETYGKRQWQLDNQFMQGGAYVQAYGDHVLAQLKDPKPLIRVQLENQFAKQFGKDLYIDIFHFTSAKLGIEDDFRVGYIEHRWLKSNGLAVLTTYGLEPMFDQFSSLV